MYFASCCKSRVYFLPASCLIFLLSLSLFLSLACLLNFSTNCLFCFVLCYWFIFFWPLNMLHWLKHVSCGSLALHGLLANNASSRVREPEPSVFSALSLCCFVLARCFWSDVQAAAVYLGGEQGDFQALPAGLMSTFGFCRTCCIAGRTFFGFCWRGPSQAGGWQRTANWWLKVHLT